MHLETAVRHLADETQVKISPEDYTMTTTLYDTDFDAWAQQQAAALRAKAWNQLAIEHLAEEVEELRKTERNALRSQLRRLTSHLLKGHYQPEKAVRAGRRRSATLVASSRTVLRRAPALQDSSIPSWLGHTRVPSARRRKTQVCPWRRSRRRVPGAWNNSWTRTFARMSRSSAIQTCTQPGI
jgi:Domain of unknown function DUF29